jgi:hypothetical protein
MTIFKPNALGGSFPLIHVRLCSFSHSIDPFGLALGVQPVRDFKNWKPDLPKQNSGSYYQKRNIYFDIPVPEIKFKRIPAGIYRN